MIKIERGIALPDAHMNKGGRPRIYPFIDMEIGDSFLLQNDNLRFVAYRASKQYAPRKWISRKTREGVRIWRVA